MSLVFSAGAFLLDVEPGILGSAARVTPPPFAAVYDEHARFVWRTLVRLGVLRDDAEDVVQEVFLVVHRRLVEFRHESSLRTWIYGIAAHTARNYRRTRDRRPPGAEEPKDGVPAPAERRPDALVAKAQAAEVLVRVLEELGHDSREVFVLAELEGLTAGEIGVALGLSPNTVSSRLRIARKSFDEAVRRHRARDEWRMR